MSILEIKFSIKKALTIVAVIIGVIYLFNCFKLVPAGRVGVKFNLYGSNKGVSNTTEVSGMVWYLAGLQRIYVYPTTVQHKEYVKENGFIINTSDGSEFKVNPILNYMVNRTKVPYIFAKYQKPLSDIEEGFIKTVIYDAFRIAANNYTANQLIGNRQKFEADVRRILDGQLIPEGFITQQMNSNLIYPESFKNAIEAKNNAVQNALTAENKVKTAEAEAKIKVAEAQGDAESMLTRARAEAESNRMKQQTLSPMLLQQQWIDAWRATGGNVPQYIMGSNGFIPMMNMGK
jgi:regulator of protease activity HflC (stomatin/prohibitin superfamily)